MKEREREKEIVGECIDLFETGNGTGPDRLSPITALLHFYLPITSIEEKRRSACGVGNE